LLTGNTGDEASAADFAARLQLAIHTQQVTPGGPAIRLARQ
jgi:hypothetical protein